MRKEVYEEGCVVMSINSKQTLSLFYTENNYSNQFYSWSDILVHDKWLSARNIISSYGLFCNVYSILAFNQINYWTNIELYEICFVMFTVLVLSSSILFCVNMFAWFCYIDSIAWTLKRKNKKKVEDYKSWKSVENYCV